ncbi:mitochondrial carnitine/acylcarnitine carrier protein CACL, putative [Pediculus humanus corporis]|uniref:Mitochondrial basic amino acids transporter n=1 Tax=Pediculus humanus subsp. corporis TaxID=121224 RepID=E0VNX0_PEDHC|nr:mitochondrial carnitine/acylcarnitine carrier protein CACL, putative [Pediculus humanus corporis]EEB15076.1 mitochondrial carnitine/acylcarnitine carrier protein CACL, putative [Pediculus humanus corporis]
MALDFVAGCFGGCAGILVGHPLDTIKIRIQTQDYKNPQYRGTIHCFKKVIEKESLSGLYKGISSPLAGVAVINAIVFGVYGTVQKNLTEPESLKSCFASGAVAGLVQSFICSPMELVKSRTQIQESKIITGPFQTFRDIYRKQGLKGIFKGLNITFLREGLGFGIYFSTYEWLTRNNDSKPISTLHLLGAGGTAGAASWMFTYPLDVIKSRIQIDGMSGNKQYQNSFDCLIKSVRTEGLRFLFRGLSPTLIRAFPSNAATWAVVSWIMELFKTNQVPEKNAEFMENNFWDGIPSKSIYSYNFCFMYNSYVKYLTDNTFREFD